MIADMRSGGLFPAVTQRIVAEKCESRRGRGSSAKKKQPTFGLGRFRRIAHRPRAPIPLSARAEKPCFRHSSARAGLVHRPVWLRDMSKLRFYHPESPAMPIGLLPCKSMPLSYLALCVSLTDMSRQSLVSGRGG